MKEYEAVSFPYTALQKWGDVKPLLFISLLYHGKKVIDQKLSKEREILA